VRRPTIYDSLTRESRLFSPLVPPKVNLFVCGLTPYAEAHIGHAKTAVTFDVVARTFTHWGYRVFHIQNVTNLDDKVIARAAELGSDPLVVADRNAISWQLAMQRLGVRTVNYYPYATDFIPEIIHQTETLVTKGVAYVAEGSVYFEVAKFPEYGKLSGQRVEALRPGARVEVDRRKRSPEDFVIWKAATPGEPSWDSPWGPGRPGWHIEDTAITLRLLGERYDLHGGGLDLIFPHHEAEIALAESTTGKSPLVNFWMHVGLLNMGGEKMSKSLGNVYSLDSALDEFGPMVLRFYYVNAHYRSPLDFVPGKSLEEAREAYERLDGSLQKIRTLLRAEGLERGGQELPAELAQSASDTLDAMEKAMADDFNTREAMARLFEWVTTIQPWMPRIESLSGTALGTLSSPFRWAEDVLGLFEQGPAAMTEGWSRVVEVAIAARARARARGDFTEADRIRDELARAGVRIEDHAGSTRWSVAQES
jgi:cysteinyl-tRNA synthetase